MANTGLLVASRALILPTKIFIGKGLSAIPTCSCTICIHGLIFRFFLLDSWHEISMKPFSHVLLVVDHAKGLALAPPY